MKNRSAAIVLTVLTGCVFTGASWAEGVTELATLKSDGVPANWIALSADGTRLAVARRMTAFEIWDVAKGTKICTGTNPILTSNYLGRTLITFGSSPGAWLAHGPAGALGKRGYQAWDSTTGREIGSAIVPDGERTTAAVSADGKYLATVHNGRIDELIVWDLAAHKARWRLKGSRHYGPVTWRDFLAFSPDGGRLAFYRTGKPTSMTATAPPGTINRLLMLTLAADKDTPAVSVLADPITFGKTFETFGLFGNPRAALEWPSNGKFLVLRTGRDIEALDATTGKSKAHFVLPLPVGWHEEQTVLSANGSRFAGSYSRGVRHGIVIWDTRGRKVLGVVGLPDRAEGGGGPGASGNIKRGPGGSGLLIFNSEERVRTELIALSGDGGRLAVSDTLGTVRVYDVSKISGSTKITPSLPTAAEAADIRKTYERSVARAREVLLNLIEANIKTMQTNARFNNKEVDEAAVARLRDAKDRFAKTGMVPWDKELFGPTNTYLCNLEKASAHVIATYAGAPVPQDLRDLMHKQVVARWKHFPGDHTLTLYSSGKLNDPAGPNTWSFDSGRLTFRWKDAKAPAGCWVLRCDLAPDGLSYAGHDENRKSMRVSGTLIKGD